MRLQNTVLGGQANACATRLAAMRVFDTIARLEDVLQIVRGNAWPRIRDAEESLFPFRPPTHTDLAARLSISYAIVEQILSCTRQQITVASRHAGVGFSSSIGVIWRDAASGCAPALLEHFAKPP
jgi:hypothetical protein